MAKHKTAAVMPLESPDYRARSDLSTLAEADQIRRDPARLRAVKTLAQAAVKQATKKR